MPSLRVDELRPSLSTDGAPGAFEQRRADGITVRRIVTVESPALAPGQGLPVRCSIRPPSYDRSLVAGAEPSAEGRAKVEIVAGPGCRVDVHDGGWTGWLSRQAFDDGFPLVTVFRVLDDSRLPEPDQRVATDTVFFAADWVREKTAAGRVNARMYPVAPESAFAPGNQVIRIEELPDGVQFVVWPNGRKATPFYVRARFADRLSGSERIWYAIEDHGALLRTRIVATPEVTVETYMPPGGLPADWWAVLRDSLRGDPLAHLRDRAGKTSPRQVWNRYWESSHVATFVREYFLYNEISAEQARGLPPLPDTVLAGPPEPIAGLPERALPTPSPVAEAFGEALGLSSAAASLVLNLPLMIPPLSIVGDAYDALDLFEISRTGLDLEGRRVSTLQAVFLGIFAIAASAAVIKQGRRVIASAKRAELADEVLDEVVARADDLDDLRRRIERGEELTPDDASRLRRALAQIEELRASFVNRAPLNFDSFLSAGEHNGFKHPWLEQMFQRAGISGAPGESLQAVRKRWLRTLDEADDTGRAVLGVLARAMGERALAIERVMPDESPTGLVEALRRYVDALTADVGGGYGKAGWSWDYERFPLERLRESPDARALLADWRPGMPVDAPNLVRTSARDAAGELVHRLDMLDYGSELRRRYWGNRWEAEWLARIGAQPPDYAAMIAQAPTEAMRTVLRRVYVEGASVTRAEFPLDVACQLDHIEDVVDAAADWYVLYQRARLGFKSVAGGGPAPLTVLGRVELSHRVVPHRFFHKRLLRAFAGSANIAAIRDRLVSLSRATHPDNLEPLHRLEHGFIDPHAVNPAAYGFAQQASALARRQWMAYARRIAAFGDTAYVREASGLADAQVRVLVDLLQAERAGGRGGWAIDELAWFLNQEIAHRGLGRRALPDARVPLDLRNPERRWSRAGGGVGAPNPRFEGLPSLQELQTEGIDELIRQSEAAGRALDGAVP